MPCRIYKLDFQEKNLNLDRDLNHSLLASVLEIRGSNPGPGSNFSLENLIWNHIVFPKMLSRTFN